MQVQFLLDAIGMNTTSARIQFKRKVGQTNHFLVTTVVALYDLENTGRLEAPPELRTSWNPKDRVASIYRSRNFVLHSFLGWVVDALDMYVTLLNRKPKYLQDPKLQCILDSADRSVWVKCLDLGTDLGVSPETLALIDVLITWRNNVFHTSSKTKNEIRKDSKAALIDYSDRIAAKYHGLNPGELEQKAKQAADLTFKEVASLIHAAHTFVEEIDEKVLATLNYETFGKEVMVEGLRSSESLRKKYFGFDHVDKRRLVENWLRNNHGLSEIDAAALSAGCNVVRSDL